MWTISNLPVPLKTWRAINIGDPEPYDRYFACQQVEFNGVRLPCKAHPFAHVFDSQSAAAAQTQHRTNDFWQHDPVKKTWTRLDIISSHARSCSSLVMRGGEFAKSLHSEWGTMFDKSVEFNDCGPKGADHRFLDRTDYLQVPSADCSTTPSCPLLDPEAG